MPTPVPAGAIRHTGGCLQPVLLRGRADYIDGGTGELIHRYTTVHEPGGVLPIACKTRRASRCPPCAEVYRADTYQLIRAGLTGGKGIPATVADHPCVFVTLTAPSFGPVHARRESAAARSWSGPCATPLITNEHVPQMPSRQSESKAIGSFPPAMSPSFTTSSISRNDMSGKTSFASYVSN